MTPVVSLRTSCCSCRYRRLLPVQGTCIGVLDVFEQDTSASSVMLRMSMQESAGYHVQGVTIQLLDSAPSLV
jgi:hypothetical protein